MNATTRHELIEFIDSVQMLAHQVSMICGSRVYSDLVVQGEKLKEALKSDETILEVR